MRLHLIGGAVALMLAALIAAPFAANVVRVDPHLVQPTLATAFLKISDETGHGSGVHIGGGYILTAAHVVGSRSGMKVTDSEHRESAAEVLWTNKKYDVALLRVEGHGYIASAPLSCARSVVGGRVHAYGNPEDLEFVYTIGEVIGSSRQWALWASVVPVDMVVVPGQSGGAVVDEAGYVVGIAVGVMSFQLGLTGIGAVVPSDTICAVMGRA